MATNDTKVHSKDAQFPPIFEATLDVAVTPVFTTRLGY
jgi:hypothetical protein